MKIEKHGIVPGEQTVTKYDPVKDEYMQEREQIEIPETVVLHLTAGEYDLLQTDTGMRLTLSGHKMQELLEKY